LSKVLAIVAGLLVLLVSVPLLYVDSIAKDALQEGASETFGTKTTVGSVSLGLVSGRVGLSKFRVRNPDGWEEDQFFRIGNGSFAVSWRQFLEDEVEVPELILEDIEVSLEKRGGQSNYGEVLAHMERRPAPPPDESGKRFVIRDLRIRNVAADLRLGVVVGVGKHLEVQIPEIRLRNVGSDTEGGMLVSQLWSTVMRAVLVAVVREGGGVAGFITRDLAGNLGGLGRVPIEVLGTVTRAGGDAALGAGGTAGELLGEAAGSAMGAAGEGLGDAAGSAVKKGLGGLLGRDEGE